MRAGRPRAFDEEQALDRAMHVFWEQGFEGASLHDLTQAMGLKPASLYAAFGNKQALFERALARYLAGPVAYMEASLQEPTAYAVAERILTQSAEFLAQPSGKTGCMTIQGALIGSVESEPVRQRLRELRVNAQEALKQRFEAAKVSGDLAKTADAASLARFITAVFQGMTIQAIDGATREELFEVARTALKAWPQT